MRKNIRSKKGYGISQNFLTSGKTIRRILYKTTINKNDRVIEIGAGKGHITRELMKFCKIVTAIEIDKKLYIKLSEKFSDIDNIHLINQDFLKWSLPRYGDYKIFSNIPFNITTKIIRKITSTPNPPLDAWLVMEKGAAKRFCGNPYDTTASLRLKRYFDVEIMYHLRRCDFHPMPSVDIVIVHLKRKKGKYAR
jgi:23S rRNA (adenine-N6)-dimethyltransferase